LIFNEASIKKIFLSIKVILPKVARSNNFIQRTVTGIVFVAILVGGMLSNSIGFFVVFLTITGLALWEFYRLVAVNELQPQKWIGLVMGILLFAISFLYCAGWSEIDIFDLLIILFLGIPISEMYRKKENPFINIAITYFGVLYIAFPFALLTHFVINPPFTGASIDVLGIRYYPLVLLGLFIVLWANDTGAYLVGMTIGKRRLFERISPKKSWEGSIGGGMFAMLAGLIYYQITNSLTLVDWLIISIIIVVSGTFGDLVESLLKRSMQVKDSGTILPGHGGILDRFDSILYAAPAVFVYLQFVY